MDGRLCRQASRPRRTHEQQANFGYTWKGGTRKTQTSPTCTQPIRDMVRSWVRGKRAWFDGGEREKTYSEVPTQALLGEVSCWDDIPLKRNKVELEPLGACHERQGERAPTPQQERVPRQTNKQNNFLCLVIGSGTQTDQWWSTSTARLDKGG